MQFSYSDLITKFQEILGVSKYLIEEAFNKPDMTDVVSNKCISIKNFGEFHILIIFEMDGQIVRFLNAYRIYPKLLDGIDISKMKPLDVLKEFMNRYGITKTIPGFGEHKILIERKHNIFFPGIIEIEKYLEAIKSV
jgi:hypothetical protein